MVAKKAISFVICATFGAVCLVAGVVLIHVFDEMIHSEVNSNVPLANGSESYTNWQNPSTPIYFQLWLFDIVNYDEVMAGQTPSVVQMGPYTYREHREKYDIRYNDNGTVFYREKRFFTFERNMSAGSENDTFNTVSLPMLTVATMLKYQPNFIKSAVQLLLTLTKERLFTKLSVYQLIWGYEDNFLKQVDKVLKPLNKSIPSFFGLFAGANGTDDGVYEIYSGLHNTQDKFGKIASWNGMTQLSWWNSDLANAINGSDGTLYPPFFNRDDTKYMYSTDICRAIGMDYVQSVTRRDISLYRYMASDMMFANVSLNPYNEGFCTPPGNCLHSGLLNMSSCKEGAPVVMSLPHFLYSAQEVIDGVNGMHPNKEEHSSYIEVEPLTGVVMNAGKKLQINVFMEPIPKILDLEKINPVFMPIMWLNESALISPSDASKFRSAVTDMVKLTEVVKYCLIALGGFILAVLLALVIKVKVFGAESPLHKSRTINRDDDDLLVPNEAVHI